MIVGNSSLYAPGDVKPLDLEIMRHIAVECGKLCGDGMSDLIEYGTGDAYEVEVMVLFTRKEEKENGR